MKNIAISPNPASSYFNVGILYSGKDEYEKAEEYFKKAIQADQLYTRAYEALAQVYELKDDLEKAITRI